MIAESESLARQLAEIAELGARALWPLVGAGTLEAIDGAAVRAIREGLVDRRLSARVAVCEGAKDAAPMLEIGERFGTGEPEIELAIDPVDGTKAVAAAAPGAIVAIAAAGPGGLRSPGAGPYLEKLAVGPGAAAAIDLEISIEDNLEAVAAALDKPLDRLRVAILDRPRNRDLARRVRARGAAIVSCAHADLAATVAAGLGRLDLAAGISGAPETVIAAVAIGCAGGRLAARLPGSSEILTAADLAPSPLAFAAAGVTDSELLAGLRSERGALVVATIGLSAAGR